MKKTICFLFLMIPSVVVLSQIMQVSFQGTCLTENLDSVVVKNISQCSNDLVVYGTDTLWLVVTDVPNTISNTTHSFSIYPNPAHQECTLEFWAEKSGTVDITVTLVSGRTVFRDTYLADAGKQSYSLSALTAGLYIVSIKTPENCYVGKLISAAYDNTKFGSNSTYETRKCSNRQQVLTKQKSIVQFVYEEGDVMLFEAFSGDYPSVIKTKSDFDSENIIDFCFIENTITGNISPCVPSQQNYEVDFQEHLQYEWEYSGNNVNYIAGETAAEITLSMGSETEPGNISVMISSDCGIEAIRSMFLNPSTIPGQAIAAQATAITSTGFTTNWSEASDAEGYYLDVSRNASFTDIVPEYHHLDVGNNTSYTVPLIDCSEDFFYRVKAYNGNCSGPYSNSISVSTADVFCPATVTDVEGNIYQVIQIGCQCWMRENLKTTRFSDGSEIEMVTDNMDWFNTTDPAYCYQGNDVGWRDTYGVLYNGRTIATGKLCPDGWHVPTHDEFTMLERFICNSGNCEEEFPYNTTTTSYCGTNEATKLKSTRTVPDAHPRFESPNIATNEYLFDGLPSGTRITNGLFGSLGTSLQIWSSTPDTNTFWYRQLIYSSTSVWRGKAFLRSGLSVRCLKNP